MSSRCGLLMTFERGNSAEMITFTYEVNHDGSTHLPWDTVLYGPDGEQIGKDSAATVMGAKWNARTLLRKHMKKLREQKKAINKGGSPTIVGSLHRHKV